MNDYTTLSDDELLKAAGISGGNKSSTDYSKLPDEELMKVAGVNQTAEQKTNKLSTTERFAKGAIGGTIGGVENIISLIDKSGVADKDKIKLLGDLAAGTRNIFGVGPQDYKPAGATAWDSSKPIMDRVVEAPRAMVEAAAPAAIGAMVGPLTAAGVVGATTLAPNIDRVREIDKTDPNAPLTTGQMARVGANTGLQMLLGGAGSKLTFGRAPVQTVGARGVVDATKGLAATAVKDAGLGAVGVAGDKAIMEGTTPSVDDLAVGAVAGGSGGLIGGARPALREAATAVKYRKTANLPQDSLTRTSNALKAAVDNTPTGTNLDPVSSVEATLRTNTKNASGSLKQIIADDMATNGSDSITPLIRTLETKLNNGEKLDPQAFSDLKQKIGGNVEGDAFLNTLIDRDTFNQQKGYYGKGLSNTFVGKQLDPTQSGVNAAKVAGWGMLWNLFKGKLPGLPELAYTAAEGIGNVAMRGVDRMTGAADPTQVFIDKFAGRDLADTSGTKPYDSPVKALRAELMAQKLADKAEADRQKQIGKKVADYQKRTLGALSDLDKQDAKVAADKQKANTKTISDFQKTAGKMLGDVSFMPESERFNSELYSDPVNPTLLKMAQKWPGSRDLGQRDFSGPLEEVAARYGDTKLLNELQASTAGQAENAKLEQLLAQERAMRAQGINQNSMPLPPSARSAQIAAAVERQLRERTANAAPPEMPPTTSGSPFDAKLAALAARRANQPPPAPAPAPESPMMVTRRRLQEQLDAQASKPPPDRAGLFPELPEPVRTPPATPSAPEAASKTPRKTTTSTKAKPDRGALFTEPVVPERATAPSPVAEALQEAKPKKTKAAPKTPVQQAMDESPLMAKRRELERKLEDGQDTNAPPQKGPRKFVEDRPKYSTLKEAQAARPDLSKQGWYKVVFDKDRSVWQHEDDVTHNKQSRISATEQNNSSRDNVFNHGLTIKLSPKGREIYDRMMPQWRKTFSSNAIKYRETAEQRLQEEVFARFKGKDLETVKQLFSEGVPRKNSRGQTRKGKAFLNHWRHANEEDHLDHLTDLHFKE